MPTIPSTLIQSLKSIKGFNEEAFVRVHESGEQVTSIRLNPVKVNYTTEKDVLVEHLSSINNTQISVSPVPWCTSGRYLSKRPSFTFDPAFHAGAYYVQDASSMFIDHIISQIYQDEQPARVLDLCAAPGGKSTLLAGRFSESFIVSNEVIKSRVTILAENISKWGSGNVIVTHNDPKDFKKLPGYFDLMVVDAPCSGSGLFRKDPDAIKEWSEENVEMCSLRQQRVLTDSISSLKTNGVLIYSTCSYSQEENEEVCDWVVNYLQLKPLQIEFNAAWGVVETFSKQHNAPGYRFYPDKVNGEGFFVACFRQEKDVDEYYNVHSLTGSISKSGREVVTQYLDKELANEFIKQGDTIIAFPLELKDEIATVQKALHLRKSGVAVGTIKGRDFIPHHELALSGIINKQLPFIELGYENAIKYLKRQDLSIDLQAKGWMLVKYNGLNLGWIKALSNRINNYYPTDWRILKH